MNLCTYYGLETIILINQLIIHTYMLTWIKIIHYLVVHIVQV